MIINLKRVYEPCEEKDGLRVLVDKLWPRGMKKEALQYDLWAKEISPSTELRQWVHADKDTRWAQFVQKYEQELAGSEALAQFVSLIKAHETVTLLYAAKDEQHNHAQILKNTLEKNRVTEKA